MRTRLTIGGIVRVVAPRSIAVSSWARTRSLWRHGSLSRVLLAASLMVLTVLGGWNADAAVSFVASNAGAVNVASPMTLAVPGGTPADCVVVFVESSNATAVFNENATVTVDGFAATAFTGGNVEYAVTGDVRIQTFYYQGSWAGGANISVAWAFVGVPTNRVIGAYALAGVSKVAQPIQTAILSSAGTGASRTLVTGTIDTTIDNTMVLWGTLTNTPATVYTPTSVPLLASMNVGFNALLAGQIRGSGYYSTVPAANNVESLGALTINGRAAVLGISLLPDTTPPTVQTVQVQTGLTVDVTFDEQMAPAGGVTTASNYTVSGTGKGTLANNPNSVALVTGNTYRLTWIAGEMAIGGDVNIAVANATDLASNPVSSSATHTGGGIGVRPTVSSVTAQADGHEIDIAYSEPMGGAGVTTAVNYTVSGAGKGTLASNPTSVTLVGGNIYRLTWPTTEDMSGGGDITVTVTSGTAMDLAGNAVTATNSATQLGGALGSTPTVSSVAVASGLIVDVTFSEPMLESGSPSVLTAASYTVSGAGMGSLAANPTSAVNHGGNTYRLTWASGEMVLGGDVTITVAGVFDAANNPIATIGVTYYATHVGGGIGVRPTVSSVVVQAGGHDVDIVFSEPMGGAGVTTAANYTVSGAGKGSFANNPDSVAFVSGNTYRLTWVLGEMLTGGSITITVTPATVTDVAGNTVTASNSATDAGGAVGIPPDVTAVNVVSGLVVDVTFNDAMLETGVPNALTPSCYSISGSGAGTLLASNPTTVVNQGVGVYRLTWTTGEMVQGGDVIITVTGVKDAAGNPIRTTGMSYVGTHTGGGIGIQPTVNTVAVISGTLTGGAVDVTFSEPMSNIGAMVASNYTLSGTGRGAFAASPNSVANMGGNRYRLTWTAGEMKNGGDITITVNTSNVEDLAGNTVSVAGNSGTHIAGAIGLLPTVTITSTTVAPAGYTNVSPIPVTVTFSEPVLGFTSTDILKTNAVVTSFAGSGDTYTFGLTPTGGSVTVTADINAGAAQDAAGNLTQVATQFVRNFDNVAPVVTNVTALTNRTVRVIFSKNMGTGDITASNYTLSGTGQGTLASNPTTVDRVGGPPTNTYLLTWDSGEMYGLGTVTVTAANAQDNTSGNVIGTPNSGSGGGVGVAPVATIGSPSPATTSAGPVAYPVTYADAHSGVGAITLAPSDVTLHTTGTTGTVGVSTDSGVSTVTVSNITGNGTFYIAIASGVAADGAGNLAVAPADGAVVTVDNTAPTVSIGAPSAASTTGANVTFDVTYGGASAITLADTDVTLNRVGSANGAIAVSLINATTRRVTISSIAGSGLLGISLAANTATDAAGNPAAAAGPSTTFTALNWAPVLSAVSVHSSRSVDVTFSKAMGAGVTTAANYAVTGTGLGNLTPTPDTVTIVAGNTYRLAWIAGEMKSGGDITVAVSGVADAGGQTIDTGDNTTILTAVKSDHEIYISFHQPVGASATTAANYTLSGGDQGTLAAIPNTVTQQGSTSTYLLAWGAGAMTNGGASVAVAVAGVLDSRALPLTAVNNVGTHVGGALGAGPTPMIGFPSRSSTNTGPVTYTVTYADASSGIASVTLAPADITLNKTGTADATVSVTAGPTSTVTLGNVIGDGTLGISIAASSAVDGAGNTASAAGPSATFIADNTGPPVSIGAPSAVSSTGAAVTYTITYTGASSITLLASDVRLNTTGSATGSVAISGAGLATRTVTINNVTGIGVLGISLDANTAYDSVPTGSPAAGPSATFQVLNDAPVLQSVVVQADGHTINAAFSKPMSAGGISTPANYVISGLGVGNLTFIPDSVILVGGSTYQLIWNAGEMVHAGDITVVVSNVSDSGGQAIDTSDNAVVQTSIKSDHEIYVAFRHAVGVSALTPVNYTLSGADLGTLAANPDAVTQQGATSTYLLAWTAGAMTNNGAAISLAVSNVLDARGQALDVPNNSFKQVGGGIANRPTATIGAPSATAANHGPVTYTVNYADVGSGLGPVALGTGGVTLNKTGSADGVVNIVNAVTSSTITIDGITGEGTLGISLATGAATDLAGNTTAAVGPSATFIADNTSPTITFSAPSASLTTVDPITYTVTYNDAGSGIHAISLISDMVALNMTGTARGDVSVSGSGLATRTITIDNISGNGTLSLYIDEGSAVDAAGNSALASLSSSTPCSVDNSGPTVTISAPSALYWRNGQPSVTYTVAYSDVAGVGAITLANGDVMLNQTDTAAAASVTVSDLGVPNTRTVTLAGISGDGTLSISLGANTAKDVTDNFSLAAGPSTLVTVDNTLVGVTIGSPSVTDTQTGPVTFTVTYDGASSISLASGVRAGNTFGNITLVRTGTANATGVSVSGSGTTTRTVALTGISGGGTLGITITANTAADIAGNGAVIPSASATFAVDNIPPTMTSIAPRADAQSIDVLFGEPMGLGVTTAANYTVSAAGAGNLAANPTSVALVAGNTYRLTWASGEMRQGSSVTVTALNVQDVAGNAIGATNNRSATALGIAPTVAIGAPSATSTRNGPITYTVAYNDVTSGIGAITLATANVTLNKTGTANCTWSVSGGGLSGRTVTLSNISGDGTLGISIAAGMATDVAGNTAPGAGPSATVMVDRTPPATPVISAPAVTATRTGPVIYTVTYSDAGSGIGTITLTSADVTLNTTGGVTGTASVTGTGTTTRTITVDNLLGNGTVGISIAADTAIDAMGNYAPAAGPSATAVVDDTAPAITISAPSSVLRRGNVGQTVTYTVTYTGQTAITLVDSDVTLDRTLTANGSVAVTGAGSTRTVTVSALTGDGTLGISIASGTATDASNNPAPAVGPSATFSVDSTCSMSIGSPSAADARTGPVTFTITYADATAATLVLGNITLDKTGTANGTVLVTGVGATTRTVTISGITGDGTLGITIVAGTATDTAGNSANGATSSTFNVDNTVPTLLADPLGVVVFSGGNGIITAEVDVSFSEAMDSAGVTDPTNYSVSGTGAGSLPTHPYYVELVSGNKYRLIWLDGQMIQGGNVTVAVNTANVRDRIGNLLGTPHTGTHTGGGIGGSPTTTIGAPSLLMSRGESVSYRVTYSSPGGIGSISLTTADITLSKTGSAYATVSVEGTDADNRVVVVDNITGVGTLRIWVAANTATDNWGNTLPAAGPSTRFSVDTSGSKSIVFLFVESGRGSKSSDGSSEHPFGTLGAAVEASGFNAGDTIIVRPGVYDENVALKSGTTLIGDEGASETVLIGVTAAVPVLTLAQGCEVSGLTISGLGDGVALDAPEGTNSVVTNCVIRDAATGVLVEAQALLAFLNNTVYGNSEYGTLAVADAMLEPFKNNILYANGVGLSAEGASVASNGFNCYGGNGVDAEGASLATTDFFANPGFADEADGKLELTPDSPCVNAGEGRATVGANDGTKAYKK